MKKLALAAALALSIGSAAQAAVIELIHEPDFITVPAYTTRLAAADIVAVQGPDVLTPATGMSELPEPEVFAMMLLGLCLIGYRAGRDSSEKFK